MALTAQLSGFLLGPERWSPLVALGTLPLGNRRMGHVKDDTPVTRAMGVVAGNAVLICHRVIHVRSLESEFVKLMALGTEGRRFPFQ